MFESRRRALWLLLLWGTTSCASSEGPAPEQSVPDGMRVAVLTFGFFSSESLHRFDATPIEYAGMDLDAAQRAITDEAVTLPWGRPVHGLSLAEIRPYVDATDPNDTQIRERILEALAVMDAVAQTDEVPAERAVALKPPMRVPDEWTEADRVLVVLGLETRRRPSAQGITSLIGCFWFSGESEYYAFLAASYDFSNFGTESFIATAKETCFRVGDEPS